MKRLLRRIKAPIPVLCYSVCLAAWLAASLWGLCADGLAAAGGRLYPFELQTADFELVNLHQSEAGQLVTETDDPQMIWQNPDGRTVRTVRMAAAFDASPREMCLYYTSRAEEPFGVNKRVFAAQQNDGSYLFTLPQGPVAALRLDPCSPDENKQVSMELAGLYANEPAPWWSYFAPGWAGAFYMLVYPGLAAAALRLVWEAVLWYKKKRNV